MKTAKEYMFKNHPEVIEEWGLTNHDDEYMCRMMEEYAEYKMDQQKRIFSRLNRNQYDPKTNP